MVFRWNDAGTSGWHEPPYTEEEEFELYRQMSPKEGYIIYYGSPRKRGPVPVADKHHPKEEKAGG